MTRPYLRTIVGRAAPGGRLALGALLAACLALPARAQDTTRVARDSARAKSDTAASDSTAAPPGTHVVKAGETLWELAHRYFNDPFLWPEIYRVNTDVVEDPHWIYPGQRLTIPSGIAADTTTVVVSTQPPTVPPPEARPTGTIRAVDERIAPVRPTGKSIFSRRNQVTVATAPRRLSDVGREEHTAVKAGEYYAAPFVTRGGPHDAGRLVATTEMAGIAQHRDRTRVELQDLVYATLPRGARGTVGERFVSFAYGPDIDGLGRVVIPTGLVEVRATHRDAAAEVQVVGIFDDIKIGQGLMPADSFAMDIAARPQPVAAGARGKVAWISNDPVLPSIQRYVVLTPTQRDGVRPGDQFTLLRERAKTESGVTLPEQEIAVAQVIKVTNYGTTAMIIHQTQPAINPGTPVRLSAKMP